MKRSRLRQRGRDHQKTIKTELYEARQALTHRLKSQRWGRDDFSDLKSERWVLRPGAMGSGAPISESASVTLSTCVFGARGSGFRVQGSGFGVEGLGFAVRDSGCGVWG